MLSTGAAGQSRLSKRSTPSLTFGHCLAAGRKNDLRSTKLNTGDLLTGETGMHGQGVDCGSPEPPTRSTPPCHGMIRPATVGPGAGRISSCNMRLEKYGQKGTW